MTPAYAPVGSMHIHSFQSHLSFLLYLFFFVFSFLRTIVSKTLDLGTMFNILSGHDELWSTLGSGNKSKAKPKLHFISHDLPETICEFR